MRSNTGVELLRSLWRSWYCYLCCLLLALGMSGGAAFAHPPAGKPAASSYRVIQLGSERYARAVMNARGQVAFDVGPAGRSRVMFFDGRRFRDFGSLGGASASVADLNDLGQIAFNVVLRNGRPRAMFYDGRRVLDLGTLGGPGAVAVDLNEHGQVAGTSGVSADGSVVHPYRWSRATGMVDLGAAGQSNAVVLGINERGQVFGRASFAGGDFPQTHGFFWSPQTGMLDIGALGELSDPTAMNDAGTIVGYGGTGFFSHRAFRWTRATGIEDMGSLPHEFTWATDVNQAGLVTGATPFVAGSPPHPFLWTPGRGLLDLGVGTAARGAGTEVNEHGMVIGYLFRDFLLSHGFIWTRETGLIEIGAGSDTLDTSTNDVNNKGQVVGAIGDRAFIWTRNQVIIDLNTLATGGPARPVLRSASAVSESGSILAAAETGLYLLVPREGPRRPHAPH